MNRRMRIVMTLALAAICIGGRAQIDFVEKYEDEKKATYVYVSKVMLNMMGGKNMKMNGRNLGNVSSKLNGIQIVETENATVAARLKADVAAAVKKYGYQIVMKANDGDEKVTIYFLEGKKQSYVLLLSVEPKETSLIAFTGTLTMNDLSKINIK